MTYQEAKKLFETIAEEHTDIRHSKTNKRFFFWEKKNFIATQLKHKGTIMVVFPSVGALREVGDSQRSGWQIGMAILQRVDTKIKDRCSEEVVYANCHEIGMDIWARLRKDYKDPSCSNAKIKAENWNWEATVDFWIPGYHGFSFKTSISAPSKYTYDEKKWL